MSEAYIYDALRSPRGKASPRGALYEISPLTLSAQMLAALFRRNPLYGALIDDVIWGHTDPRSAQNGCLARAAILASPLPATLPGLTLNRLGASSLAAVNLASAQIKSGDAHAIIAGGAEVMSRLSPDAPLLPLDPRLSCHHPALPAAIAADLIASHYGFTREAADAYSMESQRRAAAALAEGRFEASIEMVCDLNGQPLLERDELIARHRPLAELPLSFSEIGAAGPAFERLALLKYTHLERLRHIHHAGNSAPPADAAAALLIGSAEFGKTHGLTPLARIHASTSAAADPTIMLTGMVAATEKLLAQTGLSIRDIAVFEVSESFAAVVLHFLQSFELDPARVNPNGGMIATGHPLGASGAILICNLLDELERRDGQLGLVALDAGAGMGVATLIERL